MKRKRKMMIVLVFALALFLCYAGINLYTVLSTKDRVFSLSEKDRLSPAPDVILVLGAGVRRDGSPSNMLEDRLLTALELYEDGVCETILVSGDHGSDSYDEVNVMKKYLVDRGVPSQRVFMDHAGFSTYDSLYRARAVFGANKVLIVTQKYHAYRSLMIGRSLGMECEAVHAPILSSTVEVYPRQAYFSFRESVARCKDFGYCILKPEAKFLGEKISLQDSGDVTNDKNSQIPQND